MQPFPLKSLIKKGLANVTVYPSGFDPMQYASKKKKRKEEAHSGTPFPLMSPISLATTDNLSELT